MTDATEDADLALEKFSSAVARALIDEGGVLVNMQTPYSDRSFEIRLQNARFPFLAKVSLTENGFWGVQFARWATMEASGKEDLVLLRSADAGYVLRNQTLPRIAKKISKASGGFRINEGTIRGERHFNGIDDFLDVLLRRRT